MTLILRSISDRLLPIALLFGLTACGGGAAFNDSGEAPSAGGAPDSDSALVILPSAENEIVTRVESAEVLLADDSTTAEVVEPAETVTLEPEPEPEPEHESGSDSASVSSGQAAAPAAIELAPAEVVPKEYSVADITDLILVTGQSNATGADTTFDAERDSPHERVFAFTENGWQRADLHQVWDLGWFPRTTPGGDPSNNFALHAAKEMAYRRPDRVIGFVLITAPGMGIEHWNAAGDFFPEIDRKVIAAINQLPHKSGVDGIFWHQGESDEGDHSYSEKLNDVIANFRQQSWFGFNRPFICGETAVFDVVNRQLTALNGNGDYWSACVDSAGLQTREDGFHFNAEGLRGLGRRYGLQYLSM